MSRKSTLALSGLLFAVLCVPGLCAQDEMPLQGQEAPEYIPLEPRDNMWEFDVHLDDVGLLDIRGLRDVFVGNKEDELAKTLRRDDLPERKLTDAEKNDALILREKTMVKRYVYFLFTLENVTKKPVIDPVTSLPRINEEGKVEYDYVAINTLRMNPGDLNLDIQVIESDLRTSLNVFFEMNYPNDEMEESDLWPGRLDAIDVRLEAPLTAEEKANFVSGVPYVDEFLKRTSEFDLVNGTCELPAEIPVRGKIRGVVFFAGIPRNLNEYSMYFSGISNQYRVKRKGVQKLAYFRRVAKFVFTEIGDEFEIDRDILDFVIYERVYRKQFMGLDSRLGIRRLENWEDERSKIQNLEIGDPVEHWETDENQKK